MVVDVVFRRWSIVGGRQRTSLFIIKEKSVGEQGKGRGKKKGKGKK